MLSFSTDDLAPEDRFDHWCEVRGRALFGVTIELAPEKRRDFHGRFSAVPIGGAVFAEMKASSYRVSRTRADISRLSSDSISISHQVRGAGWMDLGNENVHFLADGALAVSHSDHELAATPLRSDGFHFRTLKIPSSLFPAIADVARRVTPEPFAASNRMTPLIFGTFEHLIANAASLSAPEPLLRDIAQLVLLARGLVTAGTAESRAALRSGHLCAARKLMDDNLHRPELTPEWVAHAFGISVRHLHVLFEPTGTSFARTLTAMRLEQARRLLLALPKAPVEQIASNCGFDSLATFYRVFRRAFGRTPRDLRAGDRDN